MTITEVGAEFEGDSYRITHKNERFALLPNSINTSAVDQVATSIQ